MSSVELFTDPQPVFNLEVEGLHAYAVGAIGLLAHNSDPCNLGSVTPVTKATAAAETAPSIPVPSSTATPQASLSDGVKPPKEAPPTKMTIPSVEEGTKSKHHRDRPRSNGDPRVSHPSVPDGAIKRENFTAADQTATEAAWASYDAARKSGVKVEKDAAGKALGEAGADAYMTNRGAILEYTGTSPNGNFDLDKVYKQGDRWVVVEAKGPSARPGVRQAGVDAETGEVTYAMQGSQKYLEE
ncbi:MAG: hypothetical protein LC104_02495 [Bacteroidales bacterium]|nr:hypothetical protein [Bacteroidales bacterium]